MKSTGGWVVVRGRLAGPASIVVATTVMVALGGWSRVAVEARAGWFHDRDACAPGTRHAKAEWGPEFEHARYLGRLDCAGLAIVAERSRMQSNLRSRSFLLFPWRAPTSASGAVEPTFESVTIPPARDDTDTPRPASPTSSPTPAAPR